MRRRAFLASTGSLAVAGCLGTDAESDGTTTRMHDGGGMSGGMDDDGGMDGADGMNDSGGMDGGMNDSGGMDGADGMDGDALAGHPGAAGLDSQPALGPAPGDADAVVVAFEDPSCPTCRRFHETTFPEIRSRWTSSGRASFVFRGYPVVYPWGEPAAHALEATFARSAAAHWALAGYYFAEQSTFDQGNVYDRTEAFLAGNTGVDAAAVVADARDRAHADAVGVDLDAGGAAGVSATPGFLLFRDGSLVTTLTGAKSYATFETALQL